ncbi:MAG TPA: tetratricopeptide repeat protein [Spirochaetes bacterium]|nr:tetratricopeptide repeat protein [Spirochaetota bacterium]
MGHSINNSLTRAVPAALVIAGMMLFSAVEFHGAEKNAIYYNKQGWEFLKKGDNFRAIVNFKNALKQNSRYRDALLGLGKAYLKTEAPEESLKLFGDVLKLDEGNTDAMLGTGSALASLGRYQEAIESFNRVIALTEDNLDAHYGLARIYYLMGREIWARRKLDRILRANPYHYDALLLMADIKSDDGRLDEAKKLVGKAIGSDPEMPDGYVKSGIILLKKHLRTGSTDYLNESAEEFRRALAVDPDNFSANRYMGHTGMIAGDHESAIGYLEKALSLFPGNPAVLYGLGLAREKSGDTEKALDYYLKAGERAQSDDVAAAKIEDFLVVNGFKIGHPVRVGKGKGHIEKARKSLKENLADETVLHLRRALFLNPMLREAQEKLRDLYHTMGYYRFYVDEIKALAAMHPEAGFQDQLNIAVIKRRDKLYARAGYPVDPPERDVPRVLTLNFRQSRDLARHPDAGELLANYIGFALGQMGRQAPVSFKKRLEVNRKLVGGEDSFGDDLEKISYMVKSGELESPDYLLFGPYRESGSHLDITLQLMDFRTGVIIKEVPLSESGKEALPRIALRAAKQVYDAVPYRGRVLKIEEPRVYANLGSFDGVRAGDYLVAYRGSGDRAPGAVKKKKILLKVEETDTLLCAALTESEADLRDLDVDERVYPLEKRRARMIR